MTNEDDWVFDPFSGVGSTLIAAIKNNRRTLGAEKELDYIEITINRIHDYYSGNLKIRPLGKKVHKPSGSEKVSKVPDEWKNGDGAYQ